jgi:hypothetical protein
MKTWHKGAAVVALVGAGLAWRRYREGEGLGLFGVAFGRSSDKYALIRAASRQVKAAKNNERLSDYRKAEDRGLFWGSAPNDGEALVKTAYWLAVAARLSGARELADAAQKNLGQGSAVLVTLGGSLPDTLIGQIYDRAAERVAATGDTPGLRAVAAILGRQATEGARETAEGVRRETSAAGKAAGTLRGMKDDAGRAFENAASAAEVIRGVLTGERPRGEDPAAWLIKKWAIRAGLGLTVLIGLRIALAPQIATARRVAGQGRALVARARTAAEGARRALAAPSPPLE